MERKRALSEDTHAKAPSLNVRAVREMAIMAELGRVISSNIEIEKIYDKFALEAQKLIPFDQLSIQLIDEDREAFTISYVWGFNIPGRMPGDKIKFSGSIGEVVVNRRSGVFSSFNDVRDHIRQFPDAAAVLTEKAGIRSLICVPLISRGAAIGTLHFRSRTFDAYTERDLHWAERIGRQIAGAIANAQLYANLARTEADLRAREKELRKSEHYFRSLIDCAGDAIFILDIISNKIVDCNRQACVSLGYIREEIVQLSPADIECKSSAEEIEAVHAEVKARRIAYVQGWHRRKDGTVFPVEIHFGLLDTPERNCAVAIVRDITERVRNEQVLSESRKMTERLLQEAAIIAETGREISSTLDINEVYERLAAESRKLILYDRMAVNRINAREGTYTQLYVAGQDHPARGVGKSFPLAGSATEDVWKRKVGVIVQGRDESESDRTYPYESTLLKSGLLSLLSVPLIAGDDVIGSMTYRSRKPNAYTEADLRLAEGLGRVITGAIVNAQLYTDLQRTEKSYREGKELYSRLINAVPDIVLLLDTERRITFANDVALMAGGYADVSELIDRDILEYVVPEEREQTAEKMKLMFAQQQGPLTVRVVLKGRIVVWETNSDVLRNPDGSPYGAIIVGRDVTERIKMEAKLHQVLETLEERIRQRTQELEETNTALRVLLKKGEEDLRKKDHDFMGSINQLIIPFLQKLQSCNSLEQQRSFARIIETNLTNITSPFLNNLGDSQRNLTPTETQVATLIRSGMSSKDIAQTLNVSVGTVVTHRNKIRKKLKLTLRKTNLRSHLLSMS